ncbi:TPA: cytochrome o ubiquinol oxidase subunit IV [Burkholderia vietnamiensis]|nr:cytochrome o ubiquinol oxidase subunit IV [Burkholderia vietnamiensis]
MAHSELIHHDEAHGTARGHVVGFVLSVLLTAASFGLVMAGVLAPKAALIALAVLAFAQILVHLVCFLHMNTASSQRWNVMAFSYTVLTALILIVGTLWVMHNVSMNMMSR